MLPGAQGAIWGWRFSRRLTESCDVELHEGHLLLKSHLVGLDLYLLQPPSSCCDLNVSVNGLPGSTQWDHTYYTAAAAARLRGWIHKKHHSSSSCSADVSLFVPLLTPPLPQSWNPPEGSEKPSTLTVTGWPPSAAGSQWNTLSDSSSPVVVLLSSIWLTLITSTF